MKNMTKLFYPIVLLFLFITFRVPAQSRNSLREKILQLVSTRNAVVGVSISGNNGTDTLSINGEEHFPLQSVFKFPIALTVLHEVDKGLLSLNQKILLTQRDLLPNTWSPLREKYPNGNVKISLAEILKYTVSESDNNGCDILLRLIGGPGKVNDYIHKIGIKEVAIVANEEKMHKSWDVQFLNWITPKASTSLLKLFYERRILSKKSYEYLWKIMSETSIGKDRIKGQLPKGTIVAHKTGTSDTNEQGVTASINDIGIVILPNGKYFATSVFVSNSKENNTTNEKMISDISKLAWDYFLGKVK